MSPTSPVIDDLEPADGVWTGAENAIADALPTSSAFRDLVDADTHAEAVASIFIDDLDHPVDEEAYELIDSDTVRGFAVITSPITEPYSLSRGAAVRGFDAQGQIVVILQHAFPLINAAETAKTDRWFKRRIERVMTDVISHAREWGGIRIDTIAVSEGPVNADEKDEDTLGVYNQATVLIEWSTVRSD